MVANVLGVGCTPPVKGLGAADTTADRCVLLLLYVVVVVVAAASSVEVEKNAQQRGGLKKYWRDIYLRKQTVINKIVKMFPMSSTRLGETENNFLLNRASSATINAPRTAEELGRDPDMRHVPTALLLAPQP